MFPSFNPQGFFPMPPNAPQQPMANPGQPMLPLMPLDFQPQPQVAPLPMQVPQFQPQTMPSLGSLVQPSAPPASANGPNLQSLLQQGQSAIEAARQASINAIPKKAPPVAGGAAANPDADIAKKINSNPQVRFLLAMGADPKKLLGKNYNAWANQPVTQGQLHASQQKPKDRKAGGSR